MRAQAAAKEKPRRSGASLSGSQEAVSLASFIGCGQAPKRMRPPCHPTPLRSTGSGRRPCRRAFYGVKKCKKDAHFSFPTLAIVSPSALLICLPIPAPWPLPPPRQWPRPGPCTAGANMRVCRPHYGARAPRHNGWRESGSRNEAHAGIGSRPCDRPQCGRSRR